MANKYRYPKGHPKAGQFQPAKEGARQFIRENFNQISDGKIEIKKLTAQEKRIYAGLKGSDYKNRFVYGKEKLYDPTGFLRTSLPTLKNNTIDLKNFLPKEAQESILKTYATDKKLKNEEQTVTFIKGKLDDLKSYKKKSGELLDVLKLVDQYRKKGLTLKLLDLKGNPSEGAQAVLNLTNYQNNKQQEAQEGKKDGDYIRLRFEYSPVINVKNKTITINLKETTFQDLSNTP
jgi:hypothetical protein